MKAEGKIYICGHQAATFPGFPIPPIIPDNPDSKVLRPAAPLLS